jgi:tetratricopeptide (TPR) repeat protein
MQKTKLGPAEMLSLVPVALLISSGLFCLLIYLLLSIYDCELLRSLAPEYIAIISIIILIIVLIIILPALVHLSEAEGRTFIRPKLLFSSRWLGKILMWLCSGWRTYVLRLFNVLFAVWVIESLFNFITFSSNNTSFMGYILNPHVSWTLINGLLINGSIKGTLYNGFLINANLSGYHFFSEAISSVFFVAWFQWEKILVIWFLYEVISLSYNLSRRMVIDEFIDYTNIPQVNESKPSDESKANPAKGDSKSLTSGLSDLLIVKLSRISELYRVVDERRAIKSECGAGKPLDANIKAEGTAELLNDAVSSDSKLSLGPVTIPTASITGLIGRIMQGPRIIVGLHKTNNEKNEDIFFLTANMVGGKEPYSWLVEDQEILEDDSGQDKRSINDMVTELAHRIFAKLSFDESNNAVTWRAIWNFNEGLRAYRDCLHSVKRRRHYLKQAEKRFIEVLEDDEDFDLAYYNLGVVYSELKQPDAAETSFYKAIELNQERLEAYYALGLNLFERAREREEQCKIYGVAFYKKYDASIIKQYEKVISLCDHVIQIKRVESNCFNRDYANMAKALNLKGHAQSRLNLLKGDYDFDPAIKSIKTAVDYSWRALLKAEFQQIDVNNIINITSECLIDLVDLYLKVHESNNSKYPKNIYQHYAENLIKQAIIIDPADANLFSEKGKAYCSKGGNNSTALSAFKCAVRINPEDPKLYAYLAKALYECGERADLALLACEKARYYGLGKSNQALLTAAEVYDKLGYPNQGERLKRAAFLEELKSDEKRGAASIRCLQRKLEIFSDIGKDKGSESAEISLSLIRLYLNSKDEACKKCWKKNIEETSNPACKNNEKDLDDSECKKCRKTLEIASRAIRKLGEKINLTKNYADDDDWEIAQDNFLLGRIYLECDITNYNTYFEKSIKILRDRLELSAKTQDKLDNCLVTKKSCLNPKDLKKAKSEYLLYVYDYSKLLIDMGRIYLESNKIKAKDKATIAGKYIQEAIDLLESEYPDEIRHYGLRSLLARCLREQNRYMAVALREAQESCLLNPLEYDERQELGRIFCDLEEVDLGLKELDNALSWKPDNPNILVEMGRVCLIKAQKCCEKTLMKKALGDASKYIEEALEICDKSRINQRGKARYWLGRVNIMSGEYAKAIPHFRILHRVKYEEERSTKISKIDTQEPVETDKTWVIATLRLAHAYLKLKAYDECQMCFDQIIAKVGSHEIGNIVGGMLDDSMYLGEVLAWAHIGNAFCLAERDGNISRSAGKSVELLHLSGSGEAKIWINMARQYIRQLNADCGNNACNEICKEDLEDRKRRCLAACDDCMGWVLYKQDNIEEAIEFLTNSVSLKAKAISYLHLALAYERKLEKQDLKGKERSLEVRRALAFCSHVERLDIKMEFSEAIKELKKRIGEETSDKENKIVAEKCIGT